MGDKEPGPIDQELIKALAHPIRVEILEALQNRAASRTELSRELNASVEVISYHADSLVESGCLELVKPASDRAGLENYFSGFPLIEHQDWRQAPPSIQSGLTDAALASFIEAARSAFEARTEEDKEES